MLIKGGKEEEGGREGGMGEEGEGRKERERERERERG